jgi:hypothetical protein
MRCCLGRAAGSKGGDWAGEGVAGDGGKKG